LELRDFMKSRVTEPRFIKSFPVELEVDFGESAIMIGNENDYHA
jgi:hypothetical protein